MTTPKPKKGQVWKYQNVEATVIEVQDDGGVIMQIVPPDGMHVVVNDPNYFKEAELLTKP